MMFCAPKSRRQKRREPLHHQRVFNNAAKRPTQNRASSMDKYAMTKTNPTRTEPGDSLAIRRKR